ncbi:hypothetical protein HELRODRAFT_93271 [Helobdella robusta]|uniref:ornithine decarboxylase n=1 Tax=Helobdella robusta TaxID=6412 RepID=T1G8U7_HELRO|nr:hypothetical protein HELRODRAFT_93271 [Helobdella robusta]ESO12426.1 hypothetical protein HELRODRAFT_93271 [Helobdella robusta]
MKDIGSSASSSSSPMINETMYANFDNDLSEVVCDKIKITETEDNFDAFYVADMGDIVRKHKIWKALLPRVQPFYAVKCNDNAEVLKVLAKLGTGFDCASKGEIQKVLDLGVSSDRIIYANPCKQSSHIKYAARHHVEFMTFDNETELLKVKEYHPNAKLVVRILPPASDKCQCELGMKFGCHLKHVAKLLQLAKKLELDVIGVSFHVGSGCYDSNAYLSAVKSAHEVFSVAHSEGFQFNLLDIGGGFPGQPNAKLSFNEIVDVLKPALDALFPEESGVQIIAEPGRFFVASAFTLAVSVISSRQVPSEIQGGEPSYMHYVNDGVYGSFNCILFDHAEVEALLPELKKYEDQPLYQCSLWGPTCDGLDCIIKDCRLPRLTTGDWLVFKDMGAYTMSAASCFNGMPKPKCYYFMKNVVMELLNDDAHDIVCCSLVANVAATTLILQPPLSSSPVNLMDYNFLKAGHNVDSPQIDLSMVPLEI